MHAKAVESYNGDYHFVKREIEKRMARENSANARLRKAAQAKKDQSNKFKGIACHGCAHISIMRSLLPNPPRERTLLGYADPLSKGR